MVDIFISCNDNDEVDIRHLSQVLENEGLTTWWEGKDSNRTESAFAEKWKIELETCRCIIVVWASGDPFNNTNNTRVLKAAKEGIKRKNLVPISFYPQTPPEGFSHIANVPLNYHWTGKITEDEKYLSFVEIIKKIVKPIRIFMSYRREDSENIADRIYEKLVDYYGKTSVYYDVDSIPLGANFKKHINKNVKKCHVLLSIIGRDWLKILDKDGRRRIDNEDDYVRVEIETALEINIPVIPLLVRRAENPSTDQLPASLKDLADLNSQIIRPQKDFRTDINDLIAGIDAYRSY